MSRILIVYGTKEGHTATIAATRELLEEFGTETGWQPKTTETFAGMLAWTQYDFFTCSLMRLITRKQEPHPDLHRDYDYTDYDAVRRFAEGFAGSLPR